MKKAFIFKKLIEELVEHYCSEINSLEDLIRLGLFNLTELLKENATDEETIKAYKIKAKELRMTKIMLNG